MSKYAPLNLVVRLATRYNGANYLVRHVFKNCSYNFEIWCSRKKFDCALNYFVICLIVFKYFQSLIYQNKNKMFIYFNVCSNTSMLNRLLVKYSTRPNCCSQFLGGGPGLGIHEV